jgi:hypothetical protein
MPVHTIVLFIAVGVLCLVAARAVAVLFRYAGPRVITCPENQEHAGVELEIRRVLATGLASAPQLRLSSCSRWPERAGCGQGCLSQIEASPESCLVRSILSDWYGNKECAYCHQRFGEIQWSVRKPALLIDGKTSTACDSIPADHLLEVLAAAKPVCFACHTATSWVREHPDLVTDRSTRNLPGSR